MGWSKLWTIRALCLLLFFACPTFTSGSEERRPKRVLIISTGSRLSPGFTLMDRVILETMQNNPSQPVDIQAENLDILRFPADRFQRIFKEYLTEKYAGQPPDLIILVFVGSLRVAGKLLHEIFPGTPVVVAGATEEEVRADQFGSPVSGVAFRVNPRATLQLIFRLQPETRRVVVIAGAADVDRNVLDRVKEAARSFAGRAEFEFWDNRSMDELGQEVSALPKKTAILFSRMFRDGSGHSVISSLAGKAIARRANVPVYVMTDGSLGTGAVGGSLASIEVIGKRAGELARLILNGTAPASLPLELDTGSVQIFDWRALKRWGIAESRLPPNSLVKFRPQSLWKEYRWYVIGALIVICLQGAMIVDLLLQRRRRSRMQTELQESKQLMELAASAGELGLWSRNLSDGNIWLNAPMRALFGLGADEVVRFDDLLGRVHPHDRERMLLQVEHAQVAQAPFAGEFRFVLPNGTERWLLAKGRTVSEPTDRDRRRMGVILDVTERRRADEHLRESEERFRSMADAAPVMIWMSGTDKLCIFFNKGWLDFTGRKLEQEIGNGWAEGVHENDVDRCLKVYGDAFDARQDFTMEYRLRRFDGEHRWVVDHGVPRLGPDGAFLGYIGTAVDNTERKRAAEALRQSEEHYRRLAETAADVIVTMDENSRILFVNSAVERVFGYRPADLIGREITALMPEPQRQRHIEGLRHYLETGEKHVSWSATTFPGLHKSGREISLEIAFAESQINDRRVFTGIVRDISERKRAEAELQEQRAELAHVSRISTMGELAASLAHELNQPLTAILSNAQAALRFLSGKPADVEEVREILDDIVQDNSRAGEVIRRMRALVKKEVPEFASLDLASLIRDVVMLLHSDAILQNVKIALELDENLPPVRGDKVQLQQVVLNLMLNAFDAMKDCPASERDVKLRLEAVGASLIQASLRDHGTGLSGDKLDKIFQPFYTTKGEGLGMGLSICRSIIEAHGGRLWAENNPDHGATFYFTVPVAEEAEDQKSWIEPKELPASFK